MNESPRESPPDSLLRQVKSVFPREKWGGVKTLVAVSGGADSVALLRSLLELENASGARQPSDLAVAHVNHGTRESESDSDAEFVRELASEFGVECYVEGGESMSETSAHSEEMLRDFRYERLQAIATRLGARYLVTGHHLDDQVETILFRIFRGTGIAGLAGIPRFRLINPSLTLVRPLLDTSRQQIEEYLMSLGQSFCVDRSNSNSKYARNFLRNDLLPQIEERFGNSAFRSIARLGEQARETDDFIKIYLVLLNEFLVEQTCDYVKIESRRLQQFPSVVVRRWLAEIWVKQKWPQQSMTNQWWNLIAERMRESDSEGVVLNLPANIRFEKRGSIVEILVTKP